MMGLTLSFRDGALAQTWNDGMAKASRPPSTGLESVKKNQQVAAG